MAEEELFEVETIVGTRKKDGVRYYKVRWKGYTQEDDTWEPEANVFECEDVLQEFWEKRKRWKEQKQQQAQKRKLQDDQEEAERKRRAEEDPGSIGSDDRIDSQTLNFLKHVEPLGLTRQASKELALCTLRKEVGAEPSKLGQEVSTGGIGSLGYYLPALNNDTDTDMDTVEVRDFTSHVTDMDTVEVRDFTSQVNEDALHDTIDVSSQDSSSSFSSPEKRPPPLKKKKCEVISLLSDTDDDEIMKTTAQQQHNGGGNYLGKSTSFTSLKTKCPNCSSPDSSLSKPSAGNVNSYFTTTSSSSKKSVSIPKHSLKLPKPSNSSIPNGAKDSVSLSSLSKQHKGSSVGLSKQTGVSECLAGKSPSSSSSSTKSSVTISSTGRKSIKIRKKPGSMTNISIVAKTGNKGSGNVDGVAKQKLNIANRKNNKNYVFQISPNITNKCKASNKRVNLESGKLDVKQSSTNSEICRKESSTGSTNGDAMEKSIVKTSMENLKKKMTDFRRQEAERLEREPPVASDEVSVKCEVNKLDISEDLSPEMRELKLIMSQLPKSRAATADEEISRVNMKPMESTELVRAQPLGSASTKSPKLAEQDVTKGVEPSELLGKSSGKGKTGKDEIRKVKMPKEKLLEDKPQLPPSKEEKNDDKDERQKPKIQKEKLLEYHPRLSPSKEGKIDDKDDKDERWKTKMPKEKLLEHQQQLPSSNEQTNDDKNERRKERMPKEKLLEHQQQLPSSKEEESDIRMRSVVGKLSGVTDSKNRVLPGNKTSNLLKSFRTLAAKGLEKLAAFRASSSNENSSKSDTEKVSSGEVKDCSAEKEQSIDNKRVAEEKSSSSVKISLADVEIQKEIDISTEKTNNTGDSSVDLDILPSCSELVRTETTKDKKVKVTKINKSDLQKTASKEIPKNVINVPNKKRPAPLTMKGIADSSNNLKGDSNQHQIESSSDSTVLFTGPETENGKEQDISDTISAQDNKNEDHPMSIQSIAQESRETTTQDKSTTNSISEERCSLEAVVTESTRKSVLRFKKKNNTTESTAQESRETATQDRSTTNSISEERGSLEAVITESTRKSVLRFKKKSNIVAVTGDVNNKRKLKRTKSGNILNLNNNVVDNNAEVFLVNSSSDENRNGEVKDRKEMGELKKRKKSSSSDLYPRYWKDPNSIDQSADGTKNNIYSEGETKQTLKVNTNEELPSQTSGKNKQHSNKTAPKRTGKVVVGKNKKSKRVKSATEMCDGLEGDLLGTIMQGSGLQDNQKLTAKKGSGGKKEEDAESRTFVSSSVDACEADGAHILDFAFDLDDYPIEKLIHDVKTAVLLDVPSPETEPMNITIGSLKQAIRDGNVPTVRAAVAAGYDLGTVDGASGMTLLQWAAAAGQNSVVELLLRRQANVNAVQKNGMMALMHAAEQGFPETVDILLRCGADINRQQNAGETALMKACKKGHTEVIVVLLRQGVDTKLRSNSGLTAQQFAVRSPYYELPSLLNEHETRLTSVVESAIATCVGRTVSVCAPPVLPYRCLAPQEGTEHSIHFNFNPDRFAPEMDIILFCIQANFRDDKVTMSFSGDNGVRSVLLNDRTQVPLLHGVRSAYALSPESDHNELTLRTHHSASRLVVCIYAVKSKSS